jgi:2-C-methyl-D-erythritol 2,4-cyclodiphosphate synthase
LKGGVVLIKVGQGFDVHQFIEGAPCIIGGILIKHSHGLLGHSDADVLLHAISDALLGAAALGDIGKHFPNTDRKFKDIDSREILRSVITIISEKGYKINNIDATIICEQPKIAPHVSKMIENISDDCMCSTTQVNIKATTSEKLGFLGRSEGIAAQAICLLELV